ncbi:type II toxin-antitoxin system VapC family toxin [Candidatus Woesearchaeota archaeon]|nr:type II toxin-antitoxin system VapC family toxin [Candidatus Woesearchaeota archaeon]
MVNKICLDTDILVNFLRDRPQEVVFIENHEEDFSLYTTEINIFELYYGAYKSNNPDEKIKEIEILLERIR